MQDLFKSVMGGVFGLLQKFLPNNEWVNQLQQKAEENAPNIGARLMTFLNSPQFKASNPMMAALLSAFLPEAITPPESPVEGTGQPPAAGGGEQQTQQPTAGTGTPVTPSEVPVLGTAAFQQFVQPIGAGTGAETELTPDQQIAAIAAEHGIANPQEGHLDLVTIGSRTAGGLTGLYNTLASGDTALVDRQQVVAPAARPGR